MLWIMIIFFLAAIWFLSLLGSMSGSNRFMYIEPKR
jgi:hypothetical protein